VGVGDGKGRPEDVRVNLGKWVLRNLFASFVREEMRVRGRASSNSPLPRTASGSSLSSTPSPPHPLPRHASSPNLDTSTSSPHSSPPLPTSPSSTTQSSSTTTTQSSSTIVLSPTLLRAQPAPRTPTHLIPLPPPPVAARFALNQPLSPIVQSPSDWTPKPHTRAVTEGTTPGAKDVTTPSASSGGGAGGDYFTIRARGASVSGTGATPVPIPSREREGNTDLGPESGEPATPASAGAGGFMGRLKTLGKMSRRAGGADSSVPSGSNANTKSAPASTNNATSGGENASLSPAQKLLSSAPLSPPNTADAGAGVNVRFPGAVHVVVAEEHEAGWSSLWRSTVAGLSALSSSSSSSSSKTGNAGGGAVSSQITEIEEALPLWALEFLLFGRAPVVGVVKIGFVLLPWRGPGGGEGGEELPEVLNTAQSKLTASRALRVRKLCGHVQDRMERLSKSRAGSARSSFDAHSVHTLATSYGGGAGGGGGGGGSPEEMWEILCVDKVLPLDMTLAAVRQFVWRQSGELVMHYRRKRPALPV
ncbi:unnamed protein product, partial [Peniophora sp. CBMAI 1063]